MQFRSKTGAIPGKNFDNEVPMKKNPDDCYSPGFVARQEAHQKELKEGRKRSVKSEPKKQ